MMLQQTPRLTGRAAFKPGPRYQPGLGLGIRIRARISCANAADDRISSNFSAISIAAPGRVDVKRLPSINSRKLPVEHLLLMCASRYSQLTARRSVQRGAGAQCFRHHVDKISDLGGGVSPFAVQNVHGNRLYLKFAEDDFKSAVRQL